MICKSIYFTQTPCNGQATGRWKADKQHLAAHPTTSLAKDWTWHPLQAQVKSTQTTCTCSTRDLMVRGCTCGGA